MTRLMWLAAAFALGVALAGAPGVPGELALAALGAAGVTALAMAWQRAPRAGMLLACAIMALLGWDRYRLAQPPDPLAPYRDHGNVAVRGVLVEPPDARDRATLLTLEVTEVLTGGAAMPSPPARVLAHLNGQTDLAYGELVELRGALRTPPTAPDFSYRDFLARQGIFNLMEYPAVTRLARDRGDPLLAQLYDMRAAAERTVRRSLPEPQASLLAGILLGQERGIPRETVEAFQRTGASHVIAISGFNLALIAGLLVALLGRVTYARFLWFPCIVLLGAYAVFVGGGAPVWRAALMSAALFLAPLAGRPVYTPHAVAAAALAMVAVSPQTLWDVGFQLSVAATLGIAVIALPLNDRLDDWLEARVRGRRARAVLGVLAADAIVSLVAVLATQPLIAYYFHSVSFVTPLVNLLILPAQPLVLVTGALVVLGGVAHPAVAFAMGWLAWFPLAWTVAVVEWFALLPFAAWGVDPLPFSALVAYYAVLTGIVAVWRMRRAERAVLTDRLRRERIPVALGALAAVALFVWTAAAQQPDAYLHVVFPDVGHGDAALIRTPSGRVAIVDGGPSPQALLLALGRALPIAQRDVALVVLTRDSDGKAAGLVALAERYRVEHVLRPESSRPSAGLARLKMLWAERGVPTALAAEGMRVELGDGVMLDVVRIGDADEGLMLRLTYRDFSVHFDGDGDKRAPPEQTAAVLKVGRHGDDKAAPAASLERLRPQFAVIPVGNNRSGDPAPETLQRLADTDATVYRTDLHGAVEFVSDGTRVWVHTER